jgi:hypothetical protein
MPHFKEATVVPWNSRKNVIFNQLLTQFLEGKEQSDPVESGE